MLVASENTPELMPLARAVKIVTAINQRLFFAMGITDQCNSLAGVSLPDMIAARDRVRIENSLAKPIDGVRQSYVVPDDRLISAVYTLEHYDGSDETIVLRGGRDADGCTVRKVLVVASIGVSRPDHPGAAA